MQFCGDFRTTYETDVKIFQTPFIKVCMGFLGVALLALPFLIKGEYLWIALQILIAVIGAVGLNILTGFTGQISLGQGAFLGVGAYTSAYLTAKLGLSFWQFLNDRLCNTGAIAPLPELIRQRATEAEPS